MCKRFYVPKTYLDNVDELYLAVMKILILFMTF